MKARWRGFGKERHPVLKSLLAGISVAGFAAAWVGFSAAQPPADELAGHAALADESSSPTPAGSSSSI
ncbi:MAG TPA: hypothetical protein PKK39_02725, partial [Tepidiformaceae bacterium]|nr:hypothetical protein [Tepidiformaceae bacterium]